MWGKKYRFGRKRQYAYHRRQRGHARIAEDESDLFGMLEMICGMEAIQQFVPAWMPQMEQFFRMVVFDYLVANAFTSAL